MMRPRLHLTRLRALLAAAAVALGIATVPAGADAASVGYATGTITLTAANGETNHVVVAPWGQSLKLTDTGTVVKGKKATPTAIAVTAGTGCWQLAASAVICPATATRLSADLGDGDDFFDASLVATGTTVTGGAGNDVLHGGTGADTLDGAGGNDTFEARDTAADTLVCGPGTESGYADALDTIPGDCETVVRTAEPVVTPDPGTDPGASLTGPLTVDPPDPQLPADPQTDPSNPTPGLDPDTAPDRTVTRAANAVPASIPPQTVSVSASGVANVKIVCPADSGGCSGSVTLELPNGAAAKSKGKLAIAAMTRRRTRAPLRIGRTKFTAAAGTAPIVPVRLSKRGRQRIVKGGRGRARIVVTTRKADGTTSVDTQDVSIRPKRAPAKRKAGRR